MRCDLDGRAGSSAYAPQTRSCTLLDMLLASTTHVCCCIEALLIRHFARDRAVVYTATVGAALLTVFEAFDANSALLLHGQKPLLPLATVSVRQAVEVISGSFSACMSNKN